MECVRAPRPDVVRACGLVAFAYVAIAYVAIAGLWVGTVEELRTFFCLSPLKMKTQHVVAAIVIVLVVRFLWMQRDRLNSFNQRGWHDILPQMDGRWVPYIDKLKFKDVCERLGLPTFRTIDVCNSAECVVDSFDALPRSFVVKYTTGSGMNLIVKNKYEWTKERLLRHLSRFKLGLHNARLGELQYYFVSPSFMIEEMIDPIPNDFKILVTDGKPRVIWVDTNRFSRHRRTIFRINDDFTTHMMPKCRWNYDVDTTVVLPDPQVVRDMCEIAVQFAQEIPLPMFRVDLYYVNGTIFGGEITLTSESFTASISRDCANYASGNA